MEDWYVDGDFASTALPNIGGERAAMRCRESMGPVIVTESQKIHYFTSLRPTESVHAEQLPRPGRTWNATPHPSADSMVKGIPLHRVAGSW